MDRQLSNCVRRAVVLLAILTLASPLLAKPPEQSREIPKAVYRFKGNSQILASLVELTKGLPKESSDDQTLDEFTPGELLSAFACLGPGPLVTLSEFSTLVETLRKHPVALDKWDRSAGFVVAIMELPEAPKLIRPEIPDGEVLTPSRRKVMREKREQARLANSGLVLFLPTKEQLPPLEFETDAELPIYLDEASDRWLAVSTNSELSGRMWKILEGGSWRKDAPWMPAFEVTKDSTKQPEAFGWYHGKHGPAIGLGPLGSALTNWQKTSGLAADYQVTSQLVRLPEGWKISIKLSPEYELDANVVQLLKRCAPPKSLLRGLPTRPFLGQACGATSAALPCLFTELVLSECVPEEAQTAWTKLSGVEALRHRDACHRLNSDQGWNFASFLEGEICQLFSSQPYKHGEVVRSELLASPNVINRILPSIDNEIETGSLFQLVPIPQLPIHQEILDLKNPPNSDPTTQEPRRRIVLGRTADAVIVSVGANHERPPQFFKDSMHLIEQPFVKGVVDQLSGEYAMVIVVNPAQVFGNLLERILPSGAIALIVEEAESRATIDATSGTQRVSYEQIQRNAFGEFMDLQSEFEGLCIAGGIKMENNRELLIDIIVPDTLTKILADDVTADK